MGNRGLMGSSTPPTSAMETVCNGLVTADFTRLGLARKAAVWNRHGTAAARRSGLGAIQGLFGVSREPVILACENDRVGFRYPRARNCRFLKAT